MQIIEPGTSLMIDLETMSTSPNAAIVSIGAVMFDRYHISGEFYQNIELQSCIDNNFQVDGETVMWWMQQKKSARNSLFYNPISIDSALADFTDWLDEYDLPVWGNGSDFDNVILANALKQMGFDMPWQFYHNRCYRTIKKMFPEVELKRKGKHHNALDDAKTQALHLIKINRRLCDKLA